MKTVKRKLKTEDLLQLEVYGETQLSPNEDYAVFTRRTIHDKEQYQSHLFIYDFTEEKEKQYTYGKHMDTQPSISPDGKQIAFLSNRSGTNQIWMIPADGGEAMQLTFLIYGASRPYWSPDGSRMVFSSPVEPGETLQKELSAEEKKKQEEKKQQEPKVYTKLRYKSDSQGLHDHTVSQLLLYDFSENKLSQLTNEKEPVAAGPFSPDGSRILCYADLEEDADSRHTQDLFIYDFEEEKLQKQTKSDGVFSQASFTPDGNKITAVGHKMAYKNASLTRLWQFDLITGEEQCLTADIELQIGDVMTSDMHSENNRTEPVHFGDAVYFLVSAEGATAVYKWENGETEQIYSENNYVYGFNVLQDGTLLLSISTPTDPGNLFLFNGREIKQLTKTNPLLEEVMLAEPEPFTSTSADGWQVHGWLLKPADFNPDEKYPFVLEIHGGPHAMYGVAFFHELQLLASRGYIVLYMNPRGSHGYGQEFVDAVRGDYGGSDYNDLMTAVDQLLEKEPSIDASRLGVTGGSYGGVMTNWIVTHTNRFKAAVTQRSISNWMSFYGVSDIGFFFTDWQIGANLWEDPELLWNHSPLKYVKEVETPLLILHSEKDYRCPIEQAEQLYIALKHLGKETAFVRFPGTNHELSRSGPPKLRMERLNHITDWFEKYL